MSGHCSAYRSRPRLRVDGAYASREAARALVAEIIELADGDALDIARSRTVEQEVLDILDEPAPR